MDPLEDIMFLVLLWQGVNNHSVDYMLWHLGEMKRHIYMYQISDINI